MVRGFADQSAKGERAAKPGRDACRTDARVHRCRKHDEGDNNRVRADCIRAVFGSGHHRLLAGEGLRQPPAPLRRCGAQSDCPGGCRDRCRASRHPHCVDASTGGHRNRDRVRPQGGVGSSCWKQGDPALVAAGLTESRLYSTTPRRTRPSPARRRASSRQPAAISCRFPIPDSRWACSRSCASRRARERGRVRRQCP